MKAGLLIHRNGSLIDSLLPEGSIMADEDLVAAMLAVIQDFMRTSFPLLIGKELKSIVQGDSVLIVERGTHATLAILASGGVGAAFRETMRSRLGVFEDANPATLPKWNGDPKELLGAQELLETFVKRREELNGPKAA